MKRPFAINYRRGPDPTAIRVEARFAKPVPPDQRDALLLPLAGWAKLGERGGLAGDRIPPPQSGVSLQSHGAAGAAVLSWVFTGALINDRAFYVLENILHYMHSTIAPLHGVVIQTGLVSDGYIAPEAFPPLFKQTPFALLLDVTGRGMNLSVEVPEPGPAAQVAEQLMLTWVGDWFYAASMGAYGDSRVEPAQTRFLFSQEPTWGPAGLEFFLDEASGNESAFDALVNVLHKAHREVTPIVSVALES